MKNSNVIELQQPDEIVEPLTERLRSGAKELISKAVELDVHALLDQYSDLIVNGKQAVIRNAYLPERKILTGMRAVEVKIPKVRDGRGQGIKFISKLIPLLYLKGVSTGDFSEALQVLLGEDAKGLSANTISRLRLTGLMNTKPGVGGVYR